MAQPCLGAALAHAEITRVLMKDGREQKDTEEVTLHIVGDRGRVPSSVSRGAFTELGIISIQLRPARIPRRAQVTGRIDVVIYEQAKLIASGHPALR